jgi:hypothetical protein
VTSAEEHSPNRRRTQDGLGRTLTFFFTAPVTRRELLHFKLLRSQVGILISSTIVTLVMRPATLASGWMFVVGLWVVLAAARLHLMGVALSRSGLAKHGRSAALGRQWLPLAAVMGAVSIVAAAVIREWPALSAIPDFGTVFPELERLGQTGLMAANLFALLLAALPGAIVGGGVAFAVYALTGTTPILIPALLAAVVVLAECWAATELLGRVLDRTDVTAVDPAES